MPYNQKALKNNGGLRRVDFCSRSNPWQAISSICKDGSDFVVVVSTRKVNDQGIGCGEGRGSSYFAKLQIISRKQPGGNVLFLEPCSVLLEQPETCRGLGSKNAHAGYKICILLWWFPQTTRILYCLRVRIWEAVYSCMWKTFPRWWGCQYRSALEKTGRKGRWSVMGDTFETSLAS